MSDASCPRRQVLRTMLAASGLLMLPGGLTACAVNEGVVVATSDASGKPTVKVGDVPVATSVLVAAGARDYIVAQPKEGRFAAFSAVCPHQGARLEGGDILIRCPAHGSRFDTADGGAVLNGPAEQPLTSVPVAQEGDLLVLT